MEDKQSIIASDVDNMESDLINEIYEQEYMKLILDSNEMPQSIKDKIKLYKIIGYVLFAICLGSLIFNIYNFPYAFLGLVILFSSYAYDKYINYKFKNKKILKITGYVRREEMRNNPLISRMLSGYTKRKVRKNNEYAKFLEIIPLFVDRKKPFLVCDKTGRLKTGDIVSVYINKDHLINNIDGEDYILNYLAIEKCTLKD